MSIRPSDIKESMYAPTEESSMSESEIKKQEVLKDFKEYENIVIFYGTCS